MAIVQDCEDALGLAVPQAKKGNAAMESVFLHVLRDLEKKKDPVARELSALAVFGLAHLDVAAGRRPEGAKRREEARARLAGIEAPAACASVADLLVEELSALQAHREALAYANRAVEQSQGAAGLLGARLLIAGRCYRRVGLPDAALGPMREAVGLLRGDARFAFLIPALLELGTLAFKSDRSEGAAALREAAALAEAKGDLRNAAIAWLNLGVSLAGVNELDAALAAYAKVRELREGDPATTPAQRGNLHNNLAGVYRRMGDFPRARAEAERAVRILTKVGGEFLAHAVGSMGEIARDEGRAEEALAHFSQARALYEQLPGAALDKLAVKLENEAAALRALGREDEAARLAARVAELRGEAAPPLPAIPLDKIRPERRGEYPARVVVELDGINLPPEVYARCDLVDLERRLEAQLFATRAGELDGHVTGPETTEVWLVGDDARAVYEAVAPVLRDYPLCKGAQIALWQGEQVERFGVEGGR